MNIFDKRVTFKPFDYPEAVKFMEVISHSYWLHTEWNFLSDVQDFHIKLNDNQREVIKRCMLAIAQVEVAVKSFWGKLGDRFPRPEFQMVGAVFSESEVRHSLLYAHLLEVLGFNNEFDSVLKVPEMQGRVKYLAKYLDGINSVDNKEYCLTLALFSLFTENVSLFSQFLIMKSFNKHMNVLKDIDNGIQASLKEEQVHALFGIYLVNIVKKENPEWFDTDFYSKINKAAKKAFEAESKIIDWIFEGGDLDFLSKDTAKEFLKNRINESIVMIGAKPLFNIDESKLKSVKWFEEELHTETTMDFFHKRPVTYSKKVQSIQAEDLF